MKKWKLDAVAAALGLGAVSLGAILIGLVILASLFLTGCTTIREIPVETIRERERLVERVDTLIDRDSTVVILAGDTIREYRWKERWRIRIERDTVSIHDTVPKPYAVEAKLTRWERTKIDWGGWSIGGCLIMIAAALLLLTRRYRGH